MGNPSKKMRSKFSGPKAKRPLKVGVLLWREGYERLDIGVYIQRSLTLLIVANWLYALEIKDLRN